MQSITRLLLKKRRVLCEMNDKSDRNARDRLATHLLKTFRIKMVTVELRKFPLEDAKHVSVTVTRAASVG